MITSQESIFEIDPEDEVRIRRRFNLTTGVLFIAILYIAFSGWSDLRRFRHVPIPVVLLMMVFVMIPIIALILIRFRKKTGWILSVEFHLFIVFMAGARIVQHVATIGPWLYRKLNDKDIFYVCIGMQRNYQLTRMA